MHPKVSYSQTEGRRHREAACPCEDVVVIRSEEDWLFCGIADGQSGAQYGAEGGKAALEAVAGHIEKLGMGRIFHSPFPDELPCGFVKAFRKRLLTLAEEKDADFREFASTILAISVDRKTGAWVLLHLGDGCAVCVPDSAEPMIISAAENGLTGSHTWLTTSDNAVSHFRITRGTLENKKRMLLLSDGATCFCRGRELLRCAKERLKNADALQIHEQLMGSKPSDDATCIVLDF